MSAEILARISAVAGILGAILSWIFANTQFGAKAREEVDKKNFEKFLKMFPPNGTIAIFENHWFEKPFSSSIFSNYDQLVDF